MARLCLLLVPLASLQLWLLPLSRAAGSVRGVVGPIDGDDHASTFADPAFGGMEIDDGTKLIDEGRIPDDNEGTFVESRRTRIKRKRGLTAQNITNAHAVNRYHRDEREARRHKKKAFQSRIIGGNVASAIEDTYAVSIQDRDGNHYCGGTLVSKDAVLTAAHCSDRVTGRGPLRIVMGRHTLSSRNEGETMAVRAERVHPRYDVGRNWQYDFALIFVRRPFMSANARVIELNRDPHVPRRGSLVSVFGWGDTHPDDDVYDPSDALQVANLRMVSNGQCDAMFDRWAKKTETVSGKSAPKARNYIHDDMMCAKNRKRDGCQGDSGGPLTYRGRQVGLTSWGVGCNTRGLPGVYARISSAYHWIRRNVCSMSMIPDRQFKCRPDPW